MVGERTPGAPTVEVDHLERARKAIERLDAISFVDAAKRPPPADVSDGPLVRAARKLERLLGIRS
jgi:hypothetical protein